jgi:hypothetical protein
MNELEGGVFTRKFSWLIFFQRVRPSVNFFLFDKYTNPFSFASFLIPHSSFLPFKSFLLDNSSRERAASGFYEFSFSHDECFVRWKQVKEGG